MNSITNGQFDNDYGVYSKKQNKPCSVILKCGNPNSITLPGASITAITTIANITTVNVNTSHCNPCIKLEFASNIIVPITTASVSLIFQIFKICKNQLQPIPVGPQWTFSKLIGLDTSDTFTFFVCDCDTCSSECCTYIVQVSATILAVGGIEVATTSTVNINSATLSALVVEGIN